MKYGVFLSSFGSRSAGGKLIWVSEAAPLDPTGDMFPIQSSQGMMKLPFLTEEIGYRWPFLGHSGTRDHFLLILLDDGWAHFVNNAADGIMSYMEAIHQGMVAVSCYQKPRGDGQPQSRLQCLPEEGIFLGDWWSQSVKQFPEHSWFYSDKVLECSFILDLKLSYQSLILPIKCSPMQPWQHQPPPSPMSPPPLVHCNG